jgi:molecular chaperone IbpA
VQENSLVISGKAQKEDDETNGRYLHRGIARRAFERRFSLADHIKVTGASMDNGLLHVDLVREVPEEAKPRQVKIGDVPAPKQVEQQKAA